MTTYSINLDDVDLALLPLHSRSNDFLKKELYEFEVVVKDKVEPPITFYTCHICAVEVPAAFASEHDSSIKHRANARIASTAALRMRALASSHPVIVPESQPFKSFCANCSTLVDDNHESSKEHSIAVVHDKLLWDLMKAYVNNNQGFKDGDSVMNLSGDEENRFEDDISKKDENANDRKESNLDVNHKATGDDNSKSGERIAKGNGRVDVNHKASGSENAKTVDSCHVETIEYRHWVKPSKTEKSKIQPAPPSTSRIYNTNARVLDILKGGIKEQETLATRNDIARQLLKNHGKESYIELLCKIVNADQTSYEFKEADGAIQMHQRKGIIDVPMDNFHSYLYEFKHTVVKCIVCKTRFPVSDAETHKYEIGHMNQVAKVGDAHCMRKINSYYHCIICNIKIISKKVAAHIKSGEHIKRKKCLTKTKTNTTNDEKPDKIAVNQVENGSIHFNKNSSNDNVMKKAKDLNTMTNTDTTEKKSDRIDDTNSKEDSSNIDINDSDNKATGKQIVDIGESTNWFRASLAEAFSEIKDEMKIIQHDKEINVINDDFDYTDLKHEQEAIKVDNNKHSNDLSTEEPDVYHATYLFIESTTKQSVEASIKEDSTIKIDTVLPTTSSFSNAEESDVYHPTYRFIESTTKQSVEASIKEDSTINIDTVLPTTSSFSNAEESDVYHATYLFIESTTKQSVEASIKEDSTINIDTVLPTTSSFSNAAEPDVYHPTYRFIDSTTKQCVEAPIKEDSTINIETVLPTTSLLSNAKTKIAEIQEGPNLETAVTTINQGRNSKENTAKHQMHAKDPYIELLCKNINVDYSNLGFEVSDGAVHIYKRNEIIHVPVNHFHSFRFFQSGNAICIVCKIRFPASYAETHKYEISHMQNIADVGDVYCIRKVNVYYDHCIICNLKIKCRRADHIHTRKHIERKMFTIKTNIHTTEEKLNGISDVEKESKNNGKTIEINTDTSEDGTDVKDENGIGESVA